MTGTHGAPQHPTLLGKATAVFTVLNVLTSLSWATALGWTFLTRQTARWCTVTDLQSGTRGMAQR